MKIIKWAKRIGIGLLSLIILIIITGVIYEQLERKKVQKYAEARNGSFVDLGEYQLYYEKDGTGSPTIIFESGFPGDHRVWANSYIRNEVSKHGTTLIYDRAGLLWSRGNKPQNAETLSDDLYNLLQNGGFAKPYVLVGHSAAGIYLRPFIEKHSNDILGVVLADPSHPDQVYKAPEELRNYLNIPIKPTKWLLDFANNTGMLRLLTADTLLFHSVKGGGVYQELKFLIEEISSLSPETTFGDIPLVVFTAGSREQWAATIKDEALINKMHDYWDSLQAEIANTSTNGKRIISDSSSHNSILYIERERITQEILQMIQPTRGVVTK
jgi:pimeloyl-ACP methyl ester carboxylesterase